MAVFFVILYSESLLIGSPAFNPESGPAVLQPYGLQRLIVPLSKGLTCTERHAKAQECTG